MGTAMINTYLSKGLISFYKHLNYMTSVEFNIAIGSIRSNKTIKGKLSLGLFKGIWSSSSKTNNKFASELSIFVTYPWIYLNVKFVTLKKDKCGFFFKENPLHYFNHHTCIDIKRLTISTSYPVIISAIAQRMC